MTLQLTENAITVLRARYLLGGEEPEDLFRRVANAIAQAEETKPAKARWAEVFYEMIASTKFMPNSPTLFNAGTSQGTLSACFVIPVEDTMESIMKAATTSAMIQKFGGGIGYSFAKLRSRGSQIATTQGKACGSVAVLKMLSSLSDMITQGGKRHGANMGILHIQHPEILDFIHMKDDNRTAQNFNISVAISDSFMEAVEQGEDWEFVDPQTKKVVSRAPARQIWDQIIDSAWKTGDPGLYFYDESNRTNPTPHLGKLESTNPCGEVPLLAHEACNLGSINLALLVKEDGDFDFAALEELTAHAARFLDNVVTMNQFPSEDVAAAVAATRKTGLGVMGWHDALIKMKVAYDSPEAIDLADQVMGTMNKVAKATSIALAKERGPYPACEEDSPIRNATRTCIAPTGSISAIAGCSSGVEPIFALAFVKNVLDGKKLREVNPHFVAEAKIRGFYSDELMEKIAKTGSCQDIDSVPQDVKSLFKTALEIDYATHVKMQATFQKHTDLAVSKTINMPNKATKEDIHNAYMLAYRTQCKGITVYRDGCKPTQVLEVAKEGRPEQAALMERGAEGTISPVPRERPRTTEGKTERIRTGHGNIYVTVNFDENGKPFEVFTTLGKAGGCDAANLEGISRLASLAMRSGIRVKEISEQLQSITCHPAWDQGELVRSAPDAVARALDYLTQGETDEGKKLRESYGQQSTLWSVKKPNGQSSEHANGDTRTPVGVSAVSAACPECSGSVSMQEGCVVCHSCGWNQCGG